MPGALSDIEGKNKKEFKRQNYKKIIKLYLSEFNIILIKRENNMAYRNFPNIKIYISFITIMLLIMAFPFNTQIVLAGNFDDGINSFNNQDYNTAIEFFLKSAKENPDDPEPHKWLARCYTELFMIELSLKETDKVKKLEDKRVLKGRNKTVEIKKIENTEDKKNDASINIIINSPNIPDKYLGKKKLKLAVLDFKFKYPFNYDNYEKNKFSQSITEYLTSDILNAGLNIVEREQIKEITKELWFENSEFVLSSTAKKIGKLYGIDYLILGYVLDFSHNKKSLYYPKQKSISRKEVSIRLSTKLVNVETGEIDFSEVLSDTNTSSNYEFESISDFELEDQLMTSITKKITMKIVEKLNAKYSK